MSLGRRPIVPRGNRSLRVICTLATVNPKNWEDTWIASTEDVFNLTWRVSTLVDYGSFLLFPRLLVLVVREIRKNFVRDSSINSSVWLERFQRSMGGDRRDRLDQGDEMLEIVSELSFSNQFFLSFFIPDSLILVQRSRNKVLEIFSVMKFCGTLNRMILSLKSWESKSEIDILFIYLSDLVRTKCLFDHLFTSLRNGI